MPNPVKHFQTGDATEGPDATPVPQHNASLIMQEIFLQHQARMEQLVADLTGGMLHQIHGELAAIKLMMMKEMEQPEEDTTTTLTNVEIRLQRNGRRFVLIFTPIGIMNVLFNTLGISFTYTLVPGWNIINLPDGTYMSGPVGTKQVIIIRQTNWYNGSAI